MNYTVLLVLLVLVNSASSRCESKCDNATHHMHDFRHVSELQNSSVAPWTWRRDIQVDREPQVINNAECSECKVPNMVAKPIYFQIKVYKSCDKPNTWKKISYKLAVGCTCVSEQRQ